MLLLHKRKSSPHARGILKRRRMLESTRALLARRDLPEITLGDVARAAGVATSSAYHFYADIEELFGSRFTPEEADSLAELLARLPLAETSPACDPAPST